MADFRQERRAPEPERTSPGKRPRKGPLPQNEIVRVRLASQGPVREGRAPPPHRSEAERGGRHHLPVYENSRITSVQLGSDRRNPPNKMLERKPMALLRKEVIQPHLPVRLPCYDFTPITDPTFDGSLLKGWATGFGCYRLSWCDGRCVQGPGTYSPRRC